MEFKRELTTTFKPSFFENILKGQIALIALNDLNAFSFIPLEVNVRKKSMIESKSTLKSSKFQPFIIQDQILGRLFQMNPSAKIFIMASTVKIRRKKQSKYLKTCEGIELGSSKGESHACKIVLMMTENMIIQSKILESQIMVFEVMIFPLIISIFESEIPSIFFSYSSSLFVIYRKS